MLSVSLSESYTSTPVDQSEFIWFCNNEPIRDDSERFFTANHVSCSRLVILNVKQQDEGQYTVQWSDLKSVCRVSVLPSLASINIPNFLKPLPRETKIQDGVKNLTFEVIIKGKPFPEVSWFLDQEILQSDRNDLKITSDVKSGECCLTLFGSPSRCSGKRIVCRLTNDKGKAESSSLVISEISASSGSTPTTPEESKTPSPTKITTKKLIFDSIDENKALL